MAYCEEAAVPPKSSVGFLIQIAREFAAKGIPDWLKARRAKPPKPIGSKPRPSAMRPINDHRAADYPMLL